MSAITGGLILAAGATAASVATRPGTPDAPNYAAANREGVQAQLDALPLQKQIEAAARLGKTVLKDGYTSKQVSGDEGVTSAQARLDELNSKLSSVPQTIKKKTTVRGQETTQDVPNPDYQNLVTQLKQAQSGLKDAISSAGEGGTPTTVYYDSSGNAVSQKDAVLADFAGYSDADQSRANLDFQLESADKTAGAALGIQQKYGADYITQRLKELELSDPIGTQLRKDLGNSLSADLNNGGLPAGLEEQVTQSERAGQAARGNIFGGAPAAAEALKVGDAAQRIKQQNYANVASFLSGTTPVAQFQSISGAQQGAAPYAPQNIQQGIGVNPNAGAQGTAFAQQVYGQQSSNALNQDSPWGNLLNSISGAGLASATNSATKKGWLVGA
jgi:hypothetical protein